MSLIFQLDGFEANDEPYHPRARNIVPLVSRPTEVIKVPSKFARGDGSFFLKNFHRSATYRNISGSELENHDETPSALKESHPVVPTSSSFHFKPPVTQLTETNLETHNTFYSTMDLGPRIRSPFESETFGRDCAFQINKPAGSASISPCGRDVVLASCVLSISVVSRSDKL